MKKLILSITSLIILASCGSKNQAQIEAVQNRLMTINKLSPLELKSYEFKVQEISDREACFQIADIYLSQSHYSRSSQDSCSVYLDKVDKMNGTEVWYKVAITDNANLDAGTRTFYLDNNNRFLIAK